MAETLFNNNPMKPNYINVPSVVFSQPNLGTVGLTETEARERYINIDVYKTTFKPLKHTLSGRGERTMMKIVVDHADGQSLGLPHGRPGCRGNHPGAGRGNELRRH